MSNTDLAVFIENLKETTTVLQQLTLCINEIKTCISNIKKIYVHNINLFLEYTQTNTYITAFITIINDSETKFDADTLYNYLENNSNYNNSEFINMYGYCNYENEAGHLLNIAYDNNNSYMISQVVYNDGLDLSQIHIDEDTFSDIVVSDNVKEVQ